MMRLSHDMTISHGGWVHEGAKLNGLDGCSRSGGLVAVRQMGVEAESLDLGVCAWECCRSCVWER